MIVGSLVVGGALAAGVLVASAVLELDWRVRSRHARRRQRGAAIDVDLTGVKLS